MKEIEVKILEVDGAAMRRRLEEIGAVFAFEQDMDAIYYDDLDHSIRDSGCALRLRKEGDDLMLTFKSPSAGGDGRAKIMDETETAVADFEAMRKILKGLGYREALRMRKRRVQYDLPDAHVVLDQYEGDHAFIPLFLEIEGKSWEVIESLVGKLGYTVADTVPWNSTALIGHYAGKKK